VPQSGFRIPPGDRSVAVLELPLGNIARDTAAMYRVTLHGKRTVNGYNGYEPLYYQVLKHALADRDRTALEALASFGPLLIAADNGVATTRSWASFLSNHPGIRHLGDDKKWTLFQLPTSRSRRDGCESNPVAITAIFDEQGQVDAMTLTDQNPATRWITAHPQRVGDALTLDLGRAERLCGIVVSMGWEAELYPRKLRVRTSVDNVTWKTRFEGRMGGSAFRAALENPRDARFTIPLRGQAARFVTLRVEQSHPLYQWAVADIVVEAQR
ncbi:MAG TPA: discoidin domain-containing protein, partial [Vicinamibacterales bacterium]|nr:discoidin domain-containing protein [Vicinamibacterales bacterium]